MKNDECGMKNAPPSGGEFKGESLRYARFKQQAQQNEDKFHWQETREWGKKWA